MEFFWPPNVSFFFSWLCHDEVSLAVINWNIWFVHHFTLMFSPGFCNSSQRHADCVTASNVWFQSQIPCCLSGSGCLLQNTHSESMIPDQGEHIKHPYSKTHHYPFPIIVCLLLHPCSLPWLHLIEIPVLRAPYLNLCEWQLSVVFHRFCATQQIGKEKVANLED